MSRSQLETSLSATRPLGFVYRYLADFSNLAAWAPSIIHSIKTTPGPVRVGTHFDVVMSVSGSHYRLDYLVTQLTEPHFIEIKAKGEHFSLIERIRLEGYDESCHIQYQIEIYYQERATRLVKALSPLMNHARKKDLAFLGKALSGETCDWHPGLWSRLKDRLVIPAMLDFSRSGYAKSKARFVGVMEDLSDKTILITGPTSGIGAAAARQLGRLGAKLIFVSRNEKKALIMADTFEREGLLRPRIETADLSAIEDIENLVKRLLEKDEPIDGLINNAGSLFNERLISREGLELTFATLLLGPYLLTEKLYPLLKKSKDARIVNVSSGGMYTQSVVLDDLENTKDYQGDIAYARAKRGLVDLSEVWAERWKDDGITVHAMHPGWTDTPGVSHSMPKFYEWTKSWLRTPEQAADTIVWLMASREAKKTSGLFWLDRLPHDTGFIPGTKSNTHHQKKLLELLAECYEKLSVPLSQGLTEVEPSGDQDVMTASVRVP